MLGQVACVQQTEEVDDNFLYVMEQSNRNTDTDSFQYWVGGKLKTFKVSVILMEMGWETDRG